MIDRERLAIVAHELRSPVAAILAIEETLRSGDPALTPADRHRMLELAVAAAHDVRRILHDPELFSVDPRPVAVSDLVDAVRGERVTIEGDADDVLVLADPPRARQVLRNLITNALRHGTAVTVRVTCDDDVVTIDVADDGPGVPVGTDPFARGVSGAGSTGLGLYLSRAIADAHGGRLELLPSAAGAVFRFVLPRASYASG